MVEFNPDGSIRLPESYKKRHDENKNKLQNQRCIKIQREVVSFSAPKRCILHISLSEKITDNRFIDTIYRYWKEKAEVPNKITKHDEKEFELEIGTAFRRCTDCTSLINRYREFLEGNIIEEKGSCQFEGWKKNFSYEDYFD